MSLFGILENMVQKTSRWIQDRRVDSRRRTRARRRAQQLDKTIISSGVYLPLTPQPNEIISESCAFESGVLREIRRVVTRRKTDAAPQQPALRMDDPHVRQMREQVLPQDIMRYFDALGILPVVGVNDPTLREKLSRPGQYGWAPQAAQTCTSSGVTNPQLTGLRVWRLRPRHSDSGSVGQNIILTEAGDVFVETAGPWGSLWMHRSADGEVTVREHRLGPVRMPQLRQRFPVAS
jgi:hypothetical protein